MDLVADFAGGPEDQEPTDQIGILPGGGFIILDGKVSAELAAEGLARDVIRQIQQARKDADLNVSDRISLTVSGNAFALSAIRTHEGLVKSETLTLELTLTETGDLVSPVTVGEDQQVQIAVAKL